MTGRVEFNNEQLEHWLSGEKEGIAVEIATDAPVFYKLCRQALRALELQHLLFMKVVGHPEHHHTHTCGSCDNLRAIIHAATQGESKLTDWQDIESAPRDGNLLLSDGDRVSEGGWLSDSDMGADYEGQFGNAAWWSVKCIERPTHWMPLPPPPKVKA